MESAPKHAEEPTMADPMSNEPEMAPSDTAMKTARAPLRLHRQRGQLVDLVVPHHSRRARAAGGISSGKHQRWRHGRRAEP
jgi:hypothetical protein